MAERPVAHLAAKEASPAVHLSVHGECAGVEGSRLDLNDRQTNEIDAGEVLLSTDF